MNPETPNHANDSFRKEELNMEAHDLPQQVVPVPETALSNESQGIQADGSLGDLQPSYRQEMEQVAPEATHLEDTEALHQDPEYYWEALSEKDSATVEAGTQRLLDAYDAMTKELGVSASKYHNMSERIDTFTKEMAAQFAVHIEQIAGDTVRLPGRQTLPDEMVAAIDTAKRSLEALRAVNAGQPLSDVNWAELGVKLPRLARDATKRQAAVAQLSSILSNAQQVVSSRFDRDEDIQRRATHAIAQRSSSGQVLDYVTSNSDELTQPLELDDDSLGILAATGLIDATSLIDQFKTSVSHQLESKARQRLFREQQVALYKIRNPGVDEKYIDADDLARMPLDSILYVYGDATLAGFRARQALQGEREDRLMQTYHALLVAQEQEDRVNDDIARHRDIREGMANGAKENFQMSIMPGDTVLEHYTAFALEVMTSNGLHPKTTHGRSAINSRRSSSQVHFTSQNDDQGIDYSLYAQWNLGINQALRADVNTKAVSGMFTISLADAIEDGLSEALLTTRQVNGKNLPEDICLADASGGPANLSLDKLDFVIGTFANAPFSPQLPYESARIARLRELEAQWHPDLGINLQDFIEQNLDELSIAKTVLVSAGVDQAWVDTHVHTDLKAANAKAQTHARHAIIPLANARGGALSGEHVDGVRVQRVSLGVV